MFKQNIKVFFLFLAVILIFILLKNGQIFDLGIVFRKAFVPQQAANSLINPPEDITEAYKNLLVENSNLQAFSEENKKLRQLLEFKEANEHQLALANVVSRDPINNNILIINIGNNQNVELGQAVVVNNGIIVGKIIEVSSDSAKLRLLTDNFSKLAVKVSIEEKVAGLLNGTLGLGMNLEYIPQEQDVKKNDIVYTASTNDKIPPGLIVGQVETIHFSEEELFKQATVSPFINYNTLSTVAVITSL